MSQTVYCTAQDVQRWVKRVQFSSDTKVSLSDVEFYIQNESAIVDGELRNMGITLPINPTAKITMSVLKALVSYEAGAKAEAAANFGANKNESNHAKWLHQQYLDLLQTIKMNPMLLSDVVQGTVSYIKNDKDDMLPGGTKEGDEVFTERHILDFKVDHKVLSPGEKESPPESISGQMPRDRI